jgi:hypothetical protein
LQPEDGVTALFPRIGDYDKWLLNGVFLFWRHQRGKKEGCWNEMTKEAYKNNRLWFGSETSPYDPRCPNRRPREIMRWELGVWY